MSPFVIEPSIYPPVPASYPTPLLIGLEFSEKFRPLDSEMLELESLHQENDWVFDLRSTRDYLWGKASAVIVTDEHQRIIWTSRGFVRMTGYTFCEAYHQNPAFLQGSRTEPAVRKKIRDTLLSGEVFEGDILNYRKSGQTYTCQVTILPVRDTQQRLRNFIALEKAQEDLFPYTL